MFLAIPGIKVNMQDKVSNDMFSKYCCNFLSITVCITVILLMSAFYICYITVDDTLEWLDSSHACF